MLLFFLFLFNTTSIFAIFFFITVFVSKIYSILVFIGLGLSTTALFIVDFLIWKQLKSRLENIPDLEKKISYLTEMYKFMNNAINNVEIAVCLRDSNLNIVYCNWFFSKFLLPKNALLGDSILHRAYISGDALKLLKDKTISKYLEVKDVIIQDKKTTYEFVHSILEDKYLCSVAYDVTKYTNKES